MIGDLELHRGEVHDGANARLHDARHHLLCGLCRHREYRDVDFLSSDVLFERREVANREAVDPLAYLGGVSVVHADDVEPTLLESTILRERTPDLARADDDHAPLAAESEDVAQAGGELGNGVAEASLAERAEEGEVLPHLRRRGASTCGELIAGDGRQAALLEILEEAEVERESADSRFGDAFHEGRRCL